MSINKELYLRLFRAREEQRRHVKYEDEYRYYNNAATGNTEAVKRTLADPDNVSLYNDSEYGQLSSDNVQNIRYHFVIAAAMLTRSCVEKGLERELAYTLSDLYIEKMDSLKTPQKILLLQNEMILDFTQKMNETNGKKSCSVYVRKALEYIDMNLNRHMTAEEIAKYLKINRSYLSSLFKKETGASLGKYICTQKIKAAADMLRFSEYTCSEIAEYFCFASQSYFIKCFRSEYGCTPAEYRRKV